MGDVAVTYRIMPDDVDVNIDKIKEKLEEKFSSKFKIYRMETVPVAFGLNAISLVMVIPDEGGYMDKIEKEIMDIEGVQSAEVMDVSRLL